MNPTTTPTETAPEQQNPDHQHPSSQLKEAGKTLKRETKGALTAVKNSVHDSASQHKNDLAEKCRSVGQSVHDAARRIDMHPDSNPLAHGTEAMANGLDHVAEYLESKDFDEISEDTRNLIRSHPGICFGALIAAGWALGRFVKATQPQESEGPGEEASVLEPETVYYG